MINRRTLKCRGCDSKIITRTQIGIHDRQTHSFACPTCGVQLEYILDLDQRKAGFSYQEPSNADWVEGEEGAVATRTFSDANPVRAGHERVRPFIEAFSNFSDRDGYRRSEALRQQFVNTDYDYIARCAVHYERGDWNLFDKASPPDSAPEATPKGRLVSLYNAIQAGMSTFMLTPHAARRSVARRLDLARSQQPDLVSELADIYARSGRMRKLWKELWAVRRSFARSYNQGLHLVVQVRYWREDLQDLRNLDLTMKHYDEYRQLYIDAFETLCRLLVLAAVVESIIGTGSLDIAARRRSVSLDEFDAWQNGTKIPHFRRLAVGHLFDHVLDNRLRNGIGHHATHYDSSTDQVVLYATRSGASVDRRIGYTDFCHRTLRQVEALELAAIHHHSLHIEADGRLE